MSNLIGLQASIMDGSVDDPFAPVQDRADGFVGGDTFERRLKLAPEAIDATLLAQSKRLAGGIKNPELREAVLDCIGTAA